MCVKKITCDAMYIKKCATSDAVLANKSNPKNMTPEKLRKVLAPVWLQKDKVIPKS